MSAPKIDVMRCKLIAALMSNLYGTDDERVFEMLWDAPIEKVLTLYENLVDHRRKAPSKILRAKTACREYDELFMKDRGFPECLGSVGGG